jgi:EmrB/QacA subfamily drug resistance transporter
MHPRAPRTSESRTNDRLISDPTQRWTLALTAVAALLVGLDQLVVATALSTIRTDLGASLEQLEWTVNAYVLTFAVLMMTAAALGDRFGRRRLFAAGLGLFATASTACAVAPDAGSLIAARAVQGAGAALMMPLALALLSDAFPPSARPKAIGIFTGALGLSVPLGPLLAGAIVEGVSWRWIFWLNLPIALTVAAFALTRMRESFGPKAALDLRGLALVTGAAFAIVWGLVRGNSVGWSSSEVVAAVVGGAILMVAFVLWELRASEPMLPMQLFRSARFSTGNAAIFLVGGSIVGSLFFIAQFLQTGLGRGPLAAGIGLMPWGATTVFVPPLVGGLINRVGERPPIVAGLSLNAAAMAWIALIAAPDLAYWQLVAPLVISGAGIAMASPAAVSSVMSSIAPQFIGKASGTVNTLRQLGGAFGLAVLVAVFAAVGSYASPEEFSDGFAAAIGACAGLSLVGALAGFGLPARRGAAETATTPVGIAPAPEVDS